MHTFEVIYKKFVRIGFKLVSVLSRLFIQNSFRLASNQYPYLKTVCGKLLQIGFEPVSIPSRLLMDSYFRLTSN